MPKMPKMPKINKFIADFMSAIVVVSLAITLFVVGLFIIWGLFAIPVWIICWAFGYSFVWTYPIGVFIIYIMLASIAQTTNIDD